MTSTERSSAGKDDRDKTSGERFQAIWVGNLGAITSTTPHPMQEAQDEMKPALFDLWCGNACRRKQMSVVARRGRDYDVPARRTGTAEPMNQHALKEKQRCGMQRRDYGLLRRFCAALRWRRALGSRQQAVPPLVMYVQHWMEVDSLAQATIPPPRLR
ncbi:MAG TPA: hypothetical protein VHG93_09545, partial [Longimicrobium sp.]|nr:hypothetical protein [Longimicrobium sp.]